MIPELDRQLRVVDGQTLYFSPFLRLQGAKNLSSMAILSSLISKDQPEKRSSDFSGLYPQADRVAGSKSGDIFYFWLHFVILLDKLPEGKEP